MIDNSAPKNSQLENSGTTSKSYVVEWQDGGYLCFVSFDSRKAAEAFIKVGLSGKTHCIREVSHD